MKSSLFAFSCLLCGITGIAQYDYNTLHLSGSVQSVAVIRSHRAPDSIGNTAQRQQLGEENFQVDYSDSGTVSVVTFFYGNAETRHIKSQSVFAYRDGRIDFTDRYTDGITGAFHPDTLLTGKTKHLYALQLASRTQYSYDKDHRLAHHFLLLLPGGTRSDSTTYRYKKRVIESSRPWSFYNPKTIFRYDAAGRLTEITETGPNERVTRFTYLNDQVVLKTLEYDSEGHYVFQSFYENGLCVKKLTWFKALYSEGPPALHETTTMRYEFDACGNWIKLFETSDGNEELVEERRIVYQ